jgi:protein-S-isoprenylcysteine O-methyltransferase Ste14
MLISSHRQRQWLGALLVAVQFGLLLLLAALATPRILQASVSLTALLWVVISLALAAWTLGHNRLGNFNIRPTPKDQGHLVTSGPYHWIRHPMYTSVFAGAAALACLSEPLAAWLAWAALVMVLSLKASVEERWMLEQYPAYGHYKQTSKRFLPWVY